MQAFPMCAPHNFCVKNGSSLRDPREQKHKHTAQWRIRAAAAQSREWRDALGPATVRGAVGEKWIER